MYAETVVLLTLVCIVLLYDRWYKRVVQRRSLPPGPSGWPIIGNLFEIPTNQAWFVYAAMAEKYGNMVYLEVLGQPMLILSSYRDAMELLEKRSANNSDRPYSLMLNDLMGWGLDLALVPYGNGWRRRRRMIQNYFHKNASDVYRPIQEESTRVFLQDLLKDPRNFRQHVRKNAGKVILKVTYDHDVKEDNDALVYLVDEASLTFNEATTGGSYLVDILPILQYVPSWFPGTGYRELATRAKHLTSRLLTEPYEAVKQRMADKDAVSSCFARRLLEDFNDCKDVDDDYEQAIKEALGVTYEAGADTSAASVLNFILAMTLYPDVQKKAQAELDLVVGCDRLPTFADEPDLPYIQAIVSETVRWQPAAPLGVGHMSMAEDVYGGYRIPAGTIVTTNIWAMTRDESMYPDPETFNPDRFLKEDGKELPLDPSNLGFGFGRRICPGRHLALNGLWIAIASILSVYTIAKDLDHKGREITPEIDYFSGLVAQPKPFRCRFVPRSEKIHELIQPV